MSLTDSQLNVVLAKAVPGYHGAFSKDELASLKKRLPGFYIVNLEDAFDHKTGKQLPGSHWVTLHVGKTRCDYCDSYGADPPAPVVKFCGGLPLFFSNAVIQGLNSDNCGRFCASIIWQMWSRKKAMSTVVSEFSRRTGVNDKRVEAQWRALRRGVGR